MKKASKSKTIIDDQNIMGITSEPVKQSSKSKSKSIAKQSSKELRVVPRMSKREIKNQVKAIDRISKLAE